MKTSVRNASLAALATLASSLLACTTVVEDTTTGTPSSVPDDIAEALAALPEAKVIAFTDDGVPTFIVGELAQVGTLPADAVAAELALRPSLKTIVAPFRLTPDNLAFQRARTDESGGRHFRYRQTFNGMEIVGADLIVHLDEKGAISGINGTARGDVPDNLGHSPIGMTAAAGKIGADARWTGMTQSATRTVYLQTEDGARYQAYETVVEGMRGQDPVRDKVFVDVDTGAIVAVHPQIHHARNRKVYSANNGTSIPGTIKRTEGQAAVSDVDVNAAYDNTGDSYDAYKNFFNRDSYNNTGGGLNSTVHYSSNYCNAYWNGSQMVYGDGSASQGCGPLARSLDVTAHELTHGVTEYESGLVYSGESGGMNEALSDIFAAFVESWVNGGRNGTVVTNNDTWLVGEDVLAPALRFMCDPAADGASKDVWTSGVGNVDVHYSSGVGNLAFCLLTKGGTHPRGRTTVNVPGIGMEKAIRIMYKAQTDYLTSSSKFANVRTAMEQATTALGYDQATKDAVGCAWAAVAVGTAPANCNGGNPPPPPPPPPGGGDGVLVSGTPVSALSDVSGGQKFWKIDVPANQNSLTITIAGGTGDADLYVQFGTKPTTAAYACRPYKNGNAETCTFSPPQAGTYWVMLHAYAAYSGVTLTGTYAANGGGGGDPYLTNGTAVTNISGAASSAQYWRIQTPAGRTLSVSITGANGDADLYTRLGSRPTTSTYNCRPYLNGSTETCNITNTSAGDYYVMVRGYAAYTGLSLVASY
ncbi:MAG TPA: M4 family metallopeptidase [Kofleriaceae bacterium]|nr:M4 family metallopeptidase [Kofleriaceae bacterium]